MSFGKNDDKKIIFNFDYNCSEKFTYTKDESDKPPEKIITTHFNIVAEGDVVAKIIDASDPRFFDLKSSIQALPSNFIINNSENVEFNKEKMEYISTIYGFAKLKNHNEIAVEPLVEFSEDKMKAWIYICKTISKKWPDIQCIKKIYEVEKIIFPLEDNQIKPFLDRLVELEKSGERILIAEGNPPKSGKPKIIELKKEITNKIGTIDDKGRIDYKEKEAFTIVNKDEVIAEIIPAIESEEGLDVTGQKIPAKIVGESLYKIGQNLSKDPENPSLLIAECDGVLEIDENGKIHIQNKLTIDGNVNLTTGNIHFPGTIEINGSVEPGFVVEADGNVLIHNNVDDAKVISGGNIIVLNGIMGKEHVYIEAKETVKCKFSQNAEIKAGNEIFIKESAIQVRAYSKKIITIKGSIIGGDLIARHHIIVDTAGSSSGVKTYLTVGRDPEIEAKMITLSHQHSELSKNLKDIIDELTLLFGEDFINRIKTALPRMPKQRRETASKLIKDMSNINNEITKIKAEREKFKNLLSFEKPPFITISNETYPEVYIRIADAIKKIETRLQHKASFKEDPFSKTIIWE